MTRTEILNKIIEEQHRVIDNLKQSVDRYKSASDLDENDTSDPDDLARQAEAKDMQLRFETLLNKEKQDLNSVLAEIEKNYSEIEPGALVKTDKNYFFISVPLPKFIINGKDVYCISTDAPIFDKMKGKKVGDTIEIGNHKHIIQEVL